MDPSIVPNAVVFVIAVICVVIIAILLFWNRPSL